MISIIITSYNMGKFLPECIESVLNQEYKDFEIVIVDDGSTDNLTKNYLKSINHKRVHVEFQKNQGVSVARNFGASLSKGDYLLFLDGDDKIDSQYLQLSMHVFENDSSINYIYCDMQEFEGSNKYRTFENLLLKNVLLYAGTHVSAVISRDLWGKSNGFNKAFYKGWEDWDFLIRIMNLGINAYRLPLALFFYRIRTNSRTTDSHSNHTSELEQMIFLKNIDSYLSVYNEPITILREHKEQQIIIQDLQFHIESIYKTYSYKLGSFLLAPIKYFYFLFKRGKS